MVHYKDKYKVGSLCRRCGWTPEPTRIPIDFHIATTNEGNKERYYDITGKQVDVVVLLPVKQIAWCTPDEKGTFLKMINELVNKVKCPSCGKICSGGPLSKTKYNEVKEKTRHMIDKVGINIFGKPKVEPIYSKVELVKPDPPGRVYLAKHYPRPLGRPKGSKTKKIKTKAEIEQCIYNEKRYFEQLQRRLNSNRKAIIDTPDEDLTPVETIMKHDPTYWRILSREIKEQIIKDSSRDNLNPARKETQRGSRFMSNYYAEYKDSKFNKFDIKSFREDLFKEWQEHNRRFERN